MSIHRSLAARGKLAEHHNVLTRAERLKILQTEGRWDPATGSVFGLPKVRNIKMRARKKVKKVETAAEAAAPGAEAAAATTPAAQPSASPPAKK